MQTRRRQHRNETLSLAVMLLGIGTVIFAAVAGLVAATTPRADLSLIHVGLGGAGLALAYLGRNTFGQATILNGYAADIIAVPAPRASVGAGEK